MLRRLTEVVDLDRIAERLEGYSGADVRNLCRKAKERPFWESVRTGLTREVTTDDFDYTLLELSPSVSPSELRRYEVFKFVD